MLRIEELTYRIGKRVLLDRASAVIDPGHRVGLVGRNGAGKTTLLGLISGALMPDDGKIDLPPRWRVGMTAQEAPDGPQTLLETVLAADRELTRLNREAESATDPVRIAEIHTRLHDKRAHSAPARAARILAGLGLGEADQQRPVSALSGGWRMRVALAGLLFSEPDLLLLDEPTNHLDLEATLWLEEYLRRYPGTVLLVSHDRELLNRVVNEILHLEAGRLTLYRGGYDRFEETRRLRLAENEKLRAGQDAQRARMEKFIARFRYKATKARQAQSRLKMLERLKPIPEAADDAPVSFTFPTPEPLAPPLYAIDRVDVGYDGQPVLRGLSLRLDPDDRVALLGANGNGKSTLVRLLAGRLPPLSGDVTRSGRLRIGYFAQHQADELDLSETPVDALARLRPDDGPQQLRNHLGRFGFGQERAETRIGDLSGGEKARLLFALMSRDSPHVLLLDEPTNHLDVPSREALVQAINDFTGAVVIVSHDPHVIELTADRLWLVENGRVQPFDGDLDAYRTLLLERRAAEAEGNGATAGRRDGAGRRELRRRAAAWREALAPLRRRLAEAEAEAARLESAKASMTERLADPALYGSDPSCLIALQRELSEIDKALALAERAWLEAQQAWDDASAEASQAD